MKESLQTVVNSVKDKFGDNVLSVQEFRNEVTVRVKKAVWIDTLTFLRDDSDCAFNMLIDETAADYPLRNERFDVIVHLLSLDKTHRLRVKTAVAENQAIPTLFNLWKTANWLERETYDLFGIVFEGHPDLRRILMPDDWEGYPLRKDYPLEGYDM
jgi:NADH-quinone oxidoreductase subunit C